MPFLFNSSFNLLPFNVSGMPIDCLLILSQKAFHLEENNLHLLLKRKDQFSSIIFVSKSLLIIKFFVILQQQQLFAVLIYTYEEQFIMAFHYFLNAHKNLNMQMQNISCDITLGKKMHFLDVWK